jgi:hypothetical protein
MGKNMFKPRLLKDGCTDSFFYEAILQASERTGGCRNFDLKAIRALLSNSWKKDVMDAYLLQLEKDKKIRIDRPHSRIIILNNHNGGVVKP